MTIVKDGTKILISSQSVPAGGTKGAPALVGPTVDLHNYYGGDVGWHITNGASGPGSPCQITFQVSPDGTKWYDFQTVGGSTDNYNASTLAGDYSNVFPVDQYVMYMRAIVYGHTTNPVTVEASFQLASSY